MGLGKSVTSAPCCADFCTLKGSGAAFLKHENKEMSGWCLLLWMQSRSATFLLSSGCIPSDERTNHTGDDEKYFRPNFARTSPVLVQVACTCTGTCTESRGTFAHGVGLTYLALAFVSPVGRNVCKLVGPAFPIYVVVTYKTSTLQKSPATVHNA